MGSSVIGQEGSRDHAPDWLAGLRRPEEAQPANQGRGHVIPLGQSQSSP